MHPILPPPGNGIAYDRIHGARRELKIRHSDPVICRPCRRDAAYQQCRKKKDFFHNGFWFGYDSLKKNCEVKQICLNIRAGHRSIPILPPEQRTGV
jgi:hypothetical protein